MDPVKIAITDPGSHSPINTYSLTPTGGGGGSIKPYNGGTTRG